MQRIGGCTAAARLCCRQVCKGHTSQLAQLPRQLALGQRRKHKQQQLLQHAALLPPRRAVRRAEHNANGVLLQRVQSDGTVPCKQGRKRRHKYVVTELASQAPTWGNWQAVA